MLNFLIEVRSLGKQTLFNIMPAEWQDADIYINLAAALPSSSRDLSHGWTRPRHLWGQTPLINFYNNQQIEKLTRTQGINSEFKVIVASEGFSKKLIDTTSTEKGPSILLTNNKEFLHEFEKKSNVYVVLTQGKSLNEVVQETYNLLTKVLIKRREVAFSGKIMGKEFFKGFVPKKDFFPSINISPNLLCRANEIVYSQERGRIPEFETVNKSKLLETSECYERNCDITLDILAEKNLDLLLAATSLKVRHSVTIHRDVKDKLVDFIEKFRSMSPEDKRDAYSSLKEEIRSILPIFGAANEITLLFPTVNDLSAMYVLRYLTETFGVKHEKELKSVISHILRGGRGVALPIFPKIRGLARIARELANTRKEENAFLTSLVALYASRKLSPVLKATTAPSSIFFQIRLLRERIGSGLSEGKGIGNGTIGEQFERIRQEMNKCIPACYHETIRTVSPHKLTIVSDLPFELASHMNTAALCQTYPTTRIPITPLHVLLNYYNYSVLTPAIEISFRPQDILVINSIPKSDRLHLEFEAFEETCRYVGLNMTFKTAKSSEAFIDIINSLRPAIVTYFGHASYDHRNDKGQLEFEEDSLTYKEFPRIQKPPLIFFLIGCETASSAAFTGGMANHLLNLGVKSILATLFPVPADHAAAFLGRTLAFIEDTRKTQKMTFADFVYNARKIGWLNDNFSALEKFGVINLSDKIRMMEQISNTLTLEALEKGKAPKIHEAVPILKKTLEEFGILKSWREFRNRIVPYSLFFTLLGQSHDLYLK